MQFNASRALRQAAAHARATAVPLLTAWTAACNYSVAPMRASDFDAMSGVSDGDPVDSEEAGSPGIDGGAEAGCPTSGDCPPGSGHCYDLYATHSAPMACFPTIDAGPPIFLCDFDSMCIVSDGFMACAEPKGSASAKPCGCGFCGDGCICLNPDETNCVCDGGMPQ
jgi:hypothetical protein